MVDTITGNILIDVIIFSILTGSGAVTLLSLFIDRLSKKRAEYIELNQQRIGRFRESEAYFAQIAGWYNLLGTQIDTHLKTGSKLEYSICIFCTCQILYLLQVLRKNIGVVRFDNIFVERIVFDLLNTVYDKLTWSDLNNKLGFPEVSRLRSLVNENSDFDSFNDTINKSLDKYQIYALALKCIIELQEKGKLIELGKKARWIGWIIYVEINLMYELYYGKDQIRHYYSRAIPLDRDLLIHIFNNYPDYYKRLRQHKIVSREVPL